MTNGPLSDRITVVVLTHNRRDELCRSLTQLQALPERPCVIVIDNGSTDDTAACVNAQFPDMTLIETKRNLGAAGRNLGVQRVRTPYVAFSDDDTWWEPGALHVAVELLDQYARIAVLNARIAVGPTERLDPACVAMASSPLEHIPNVGPMLTGFMAGACVMRTHVFLHAGGYWDAFFIGGEEALLAMDILDGGHYIVYAPALTVHHWPSQLRDSSMRRHLIARNAIWTAWLRLPWRQALRRTREELKRIPVYRTRYRVLLSAASGARTILSKRQLLRPGTNQLLERVWQHEAR